MTVDQKFDVYYWMQLARTFDERMLAHWKQGRGVGGTFSQRGHEAIAVGAAYALGPSDVVSPMHRDLGAFLLRGVTPREAFANLLGRETGPTCGRDANFHGMSHLERGIIGYISHLPHSLPVALGVAMSFRYRDEPRVAMAFTGDGATNAGLYHEVLNMAGLYAAPLVIIVENNQYAYSTPCRQASKVKSISAHAAGYGLQTTTVDGNDVEAVHGVANAAVQRARAGDGPSLIEAHTLRMLGHAIHDGAEYVPRELLAAWEARDPVIGYRRKLAAAGAATKQLDEIDRRCREEVEDAVAFAEASPWPDPSTVTHGVYAVSQEPPLA
jgi:TPP-dependent pyruvate/acetoin dehydrogenase alpha subunit